MRFKRFLYNLYHYWRYSIFNSSKKLQLQNAAFKDKFSEKIILNLVESYLISKQDVSGRNAPNGYAGLDDKGKLLSVQFPSGLLIFKGNWDASINDPVLIEGIGIEGSMYRVSKAGTFPLGNNSNWAVNDFLIFDGTQWISLSNSNNKKNPSVAMCTFNNITVASEFCEWKPNDINTSNAERLSLDNNGYITISDIGMYQVEFNMSGIFKNMIKLVRLESSIDSGQNWQVIFEAMMYDDKHARRISLIEFRQSTILRLIVIRELGSIKAIFFDRALTFFKIAGPYH